MDARRRLSRKSLICTDSVLSMAETLSAASESDDDSDQSVSIHKAAKHCNVSQLRRALATGVSPNSTNHVGQPLIMTHCDADAEAGPRRWAATFATTPLSSPARPARGSPKDRRLRVSRGLLLTIYATRYATHTNRPTKHRASSADSSPRRRPQKTGTRRARSRTRAPRGHLIKRPRPPP